MMKYMPILSAAIHISHSLAWTWTHQTPPDSRIQVTEDIIQNPFDAELSQTVIDALFTNRDALQSYQQKPDCFQDAIAMVKAHCEESRMDEQERIQAAIGMTMCELATARHYLPPMECAPYARFDNKPTPLAPLQQARCVDALSRSAQFWSSYSGYLREIPQLCFTFRRWIDIDTAKDIYRNVTKEKVTLVRFLTQREKRAKTTQELWEKTAEDMRDLLEALRAASSGVRDSSEMLTITMLNNSQLLLMEMEEAIQKIGDRDRINHGEIMTRLSSMLDRVEREHADNLLGFLPTIQSSIAFELSAGLALIKDESLRNINVAAHLERQLNLVEGGLSAMQNSLEQLVSVVEGSSKMLETSLLQAKTAQDIHGDTVVSMDRLMDTVQLLTKTTHAEISSINRTSFALKESLNRPRDSEWIRAALVSVIQLLPGISLLDSGVHSHSLHLVFRVIDTIWHGTRFLVSLLLSAFVLVHARWWPPFKPRPALDTGGVRMQGWDASLETAIKPHANQPMRLSKRTFRPRYSRIPDWLCRPSGEVGWP